VSLDLHKGMKIRKGDLLAEMYKVKFHRRNSTQLFAMMRRAGYIQIGGKMIYVKKDIKLG
jgi:hypothetical protein